MSKAEGPACPLCGKPRSEEPRLRPFCSKGCADIDLLRWMNGRYAIPGANDDPSDEAGPDAFGNTDEKTG